MCATGSDSGCGVMAKHRTFSESVFGLSGRQDGIVTYVVANIRHLPSLYARNLPRVVVNLQERLGVVNVTEVVDRRSQNVSQS